MIALRRRRAEDHCSPTLSISQILRRARRDLSSDLSVAWEDRVKMLNDRPPAIAIAPNSNLNDNCQQDFQTRILTLVHTNLEKAFRQKLSRSNSDPGNRCCNRNAPPAAKCLSAPNKLLMKRQTVIKINLDLSLMAHVFGEKLNRRFANAEKRFSNDESKIKFFHMRSRSRMKCVFSSGNSLDIAACFTCKTIEQCDQFYPKVNLENEEEKETVGYVLYDDNNMLKVEITNENDSIVDIDIPAPIWNEKNKGL